MTETTKTSAAKNSITEGYNMEAAAYLFLSYFIGNFFSADLQYGRCHGLWAVL